MIPVQAKESAEAQLSCDSELEKNSPWGLARISHRDSLNFGSFNKYLYAADGGEGVDAYVIDTGTFVDHVDFEGRAKWGKTIPSGDEDEDGNGHGTHCSGTIAGKQYGVAKKATVYAVKVLRSNGSGSMSDVVKGVEWAAMSHLDQVSAAKSGKRKGFKGSVATMSLGGGKTTALDDVVNAAVEAGLHFSVAAGNDNADACNTSPAASEKAITVGASDINDARAYFSNWGKCTDIFAPGLSIKSTWIGNSYATNTISGTSMASPHICGLLAYYLSLQPAADSEFAVPSITPEKMKSNMLNIATFGALTDLPAGTPNKLAWNGGGCSNYTAIVEAGSYTVKRKDEKEEKTSRVKLPSTIDELELAIEHDLDVLSGKVVSGVSGIKSKAAKFTDKIHRLVDKQIEEFVAEISA
jgi:cerevisin